jgi:hypothetical protein
MDYVSNKKNCTYPIFFVAQQKSAVIKNQHSDKYEEIRRHQPSSPATTSHCPVTHRLPSKFLSVVVARAMAVLVVVWWRWR